VSVPPPDAVPPSPATGTRRRWAAALRVGFVVLAAALCVYAIARDVDGFRAALGDVGPTRAVLSLVFVVLGLLASAEVWRAAIASVAGTLPHGTARRIFFVTQLGKYIPGGVWTIAAQVGAARRHGLQRANMGIGALLFLAYHLASGVVVAAVLLPLGFPGLLREHPWVLAITAAAVVGVVPPVLSRGIDLGLRVLRRPPLERRLRTADVAPPLAWMLVVWACFGVSSYLVTLPLLQTGGRGELLLAASGAFALAWVVGILVIPAPAGVGAREVVFVLVLAPLLGTTGATSAAVLLRVLHSLADLGLAAAARVADRPPAVDRASPPGPGSTRSSPP
jgi:glycosyltransferase 2 family protein